LAARRRTPFSTTCILQGTFAPEKGFSAAAATEDIAKQDYILTPGRYVGLAEQEADAEPFEDKMGRLTAELAGFFAESHRLEGEIKARLGAIGWEI
jgi:type I restriction enzyme M protein